jgi:hypothetical protein
MLVRFCPICGKELLYRKYPEMGFGIAFFEARCENQDHYWLVESEEKDEGVVLRRLKREPKTGALRGTPTPLLKYKEEQAR